MAGRRDHHTSTGLLTNDDHASETAGLVALAAGGDQQAWERLVDQYARLVRTVTRSFRLSENDAADVSQTVWLRLLEHIGRIDSHRLGAWLVVTTRHECMRVQALQKRMLLSYDESLFDDMPGHQPDPDERVLAAERARDVRRAVQSLPDRWQHLLRMLTGDPPASYAEISTTLGLPVGSIGPMRGRCFDRLRLLLNS